MTYLEHLKHSPWNRCLFPPLAATEILLSSLNGNPHAWHISIRTGSEFLELRKITDFLNDNGDNFSASFLRHIVGDMLWNRCNGLSALRGCAGELVIDWVSKCKLWGTCNGDSGSQTRCSYTGVWGFDQLPYCSILIGEKARSPGEVTGRGRRGLWRLSTNGEICCLAAWWLTLCTVPPSTLYTLPVIYNYTCVMTYYNEFTRWMKKMC